MLSIDLYWIVLVHVKGSYNYTSLWTNSGEEDRGSWRLLFGGIQLGTHAEPHWFIQPNPRLACCELYIVIFTYTYHIYIWYMWLAPTQLYENVDIFTPLMTHTHLITFLYKPGWTLLVARAHRSRCSSCFSCNVPLVRRLLSTWGEFPMSSCHWSGHQEDGNTKWNAGTISPKSELASQKEQFDSSTSSKLGVTWWFHFSVHFTIIHSYFNSGVSVTFLDVSFGCSGNLCDTWRIPDAKTWR